MQKTLTISGKEVKFSTSLSWAFIFKNEFEKDPIRIIAPAIKSAIPVFDNILESRKKLKGKKIVLTATDLDQLTDILISVDITDMLDIVWSLAKNADREIKEPELWFNEFENFPLDEVFMQVIPDLIRSCITTKKYEALSQLMSETKKQI